jgi:hypothetical protein
MRYQGIPCMKKGGGYVLDQGQGMMPLRVPRPTLGGCPGRERYDPGEGSEGESQGGRVGGHARTVSLP